MLNTHLYPNPSVVSAVPGVFTYCIVNGFVKSTNESNILSAFLAVVTVTAARAPCRVTRASTACTPQNPAHDISSTSLTSSQQF